MGDLRRLGHVPVEVRCEIGRTRMTVNEVLDLHHGSVISLDRMAGEPVDLLVNGTLVAHGEVVVIDEQFGVRVTGVDEQGDVNNANSASVTLADEPGEPSDAQG